jgi:3-oxoacyl-[acyl-carrier protein] reductase
MDKLLENKTAVITGASGGIGAEIALEMAARGADVAIIYIGDDAAAETVAAAAREYGVKAKCYMCDVSDYSAVEQTVKTIVADFGSVGILVNNAGITRDKLILQMTESDYDSVLDVNLKGAFNMIKHLCREFIKNKYGRIINISSVVGLSGGAGQLNYSASKAGIVGITKSTAKELAAKNVTCNAIAPGFIKTAMTDALDDKQKDAILDKIPLKRFGGTSDVAGLAVFLASEYAAYITGEVIKIDGGLYI